MKKGLLLPLIVAMAFFWGFKHEAAINQTGHILSKVYMENELALVQPSNGNDTNGSSGKNETAAVKPKWQVSPILSMQVLPSFSPGVFPHARYFLSIHFHQSNYLSFHTSFLT